jgi:hypothetical protein
MAKARLCILFAWTCTLILPIASMNLLSNSPFIRSRLGRAASDLPLKRASEWLYPHSSADSLLPADLRVRSMIDWFALSRLRGGNGSVTDDEIVDGEGSSVKIGSNVTNSTGTNPVSFLLQSFLNAASAAPASSDTLKNSQMPPATRDDSPNFCED